MIIKKSMGLDRNLISKAKAQQSIELLFYEIIFNYDL
jgi:hypothetical protein